MRPVFLFSLPRSGSTLVQRVLHTHVEVASSPEPWVLLPLLSASHRDRMFADYGHSLYQRAVSDFTQRLPEGQNDLDRAVRQYARVVYAAACHNNERYFLDKTPRYHLICDQILRVFENGKFIFLWRHPLAVIASMIQTWGAGKWILYRYKVDLYRGLASLVHALRTTERSVLSVRFEDLIGNDAAAWDQIYAYLDLTPREVQDGEIPVISGKMGDPTQRSYSTVSSVPKDKWKKCLNNPVRKAWARSYLHWIGDERLHVMGYDQNEILEELADIPPSTDHLLSDTLWIGIGAAHPYIDHYVWKSKWGRPSSDVVAHH